MDNSQLEALYKQTEKEGILDYKQSDGTVDLEKLYSDTQSGTIEPGAKITQETTKQGNPVVDFLKISTTPSLIPGLQEMQAANYFYDTMKQKLVNDPVVAKAYNKLPETSMGRLGPIQLPSQQSMAKGSLEALIDIGAGYAGEAMGNRVVSTMQGTKLFDPSRLIHRGKEIIGTSGKTLSEAEVRSERLTQKIEQLRDSIAPAKEALNESAVNDAIKYKNNLRPLSRKNSAIYRQGLDLAESQANLTSSKVGSILDSSIKESLEQGISEESPLIKKLIEVKDKLQSKTETKWDYSSATNQEVPIDKRLSVEDLRNIKNQIFKVAEKTQDHADDVVNAIFMKNYGAEIGSQSPEFQVMQNEYAPFVEAKKWAYKTFKPFTKDEIPNGNRILKAIANGTAKAEDYAYLKRLETGSGRFSGTGNMRQESQSMADSLKSLQKEIVSLRRQKIRNSGDITKIRRLLAIKNQIIIGALSVLGIGTIGGYAYRSASSFGRD